MDEEEKERILRLYKEKNYNASDAPQFTQTVADEVQKCNKVDELAEALEMPDNIKDANVLLEQWQRQVVLTSSEARPHLIYHVARIGMQDLHTKLAISS